MLGTISIIFSSFWNYYEQTLRFHWYHMTPMKYGYILLSIGVAGWLLMKSNLKR